jgi:hypothetical protein
MKEVSATVPLRTGLARAAACLADDPRAVLGDEVGVNLGSGGAIRQQVAVELGSEERSPGCTRWDLRWDPVGHARTLPAFTGNLEVLEADGATALRVVGTYRPPLGVVGIIVDGAIGHRVAEASIEQFAAGVARRVDRAAAQRTSRTWRPAEPAADLRPI